MNILAKTFQSSVLQWFEQFGRKNLPWQQPRTPYRVWLSEIMLQQTQVATVIPYFERFIECFPNIGALAEASLDQVLNLWAGLGYYARARNLHQTAQIIVEKYHGEFPQTLGALQTLPGIGRSTAGAILSLSFNIPAPILDGNVKRILCRTHLINEWPGNADTMRLLWLLAERYLPKENATHYTQAMMDLGALVCTRRQPHCKSCPLASYCLAYQQNQVAAYPISKPLKKRPTKHIQCLIFINKNHEILLEKRPPIGIWGGLWSLPECPLDSDIQAWCENHYHCKVQSFSAQASLKHQFTHFRLEIVPIICQINEWEPPLQETTLLAWHTAAQWKAKGLAAPIKKIISAIKR